MEGMGAKKQSRLKIHVSERILGEITGMCYVCMLTDQKPAKFLRELANPINPGDCCTLDFQSALVGSWLQKLDSHQGGHSFQI